VRRAAAILAVLTALLAPATATAVAPKASLPDIENEVMCTTCKIPLNVAESTQADQERAFIRERIAKGQSKEQIKRELVVEYGSNVLALPARSGVGILAYLVPLGLVALLAGTLVLLLPRWRRRTTTTSDEADDGPALSSAETRRLDDELARYEL
jgi:cytochrome c-type biogenesis protein CcmH